MPRVCFCSPNGPNVSREYNDWCSPLTSLSVPRARKYPEDNLTQLGSSRSVSPHTGGRCPVSCSCDYLLSVRSPERERSILSVGLEEEQERGEEREGKEDFCTCRAAARPDKHIQDKWEVAPAVRWVFRLLVRCKIKNGSSCTSLWQGIRASAKSLFFFFYKHTNAAVRFPPQNSFSLWRDCSMCISLRARMT